MALRGSNKPKCMNCGSPLCQGQCAQNANQQMQGSLSGASIDRLCICCMDDAEKYDAANDAGPPNVRRTSHRKAQTSSRGKRTMCYWGTGWLAAMANSLLWRHDAFD